MYQNSSGDNERSNVNILFRLGQITKPELGTALYNIFSKCITLSTDFHLFRLYTVGLKFRSYLLVFFLVLYYTLQT